MTRPHTGPDAIRLDHALRILERSNDDGRIRDALGHRRKLVVDAVSGEPLPCYVYRLECGHIVPIWSVPLPPETRALYCLKGPPCAQEIGGRLVGRDRLIVELLADADALPSDDDYPAA
jgi:hypothetical protein